MTPSKAGGLMRVMFIAYLLPALCSADKGRVTNQAHHIDVFSQDSSLEGGVVGTRKLMACAAADCPTGCASCTGGGCLSCGTCLPGYKKIMPGNSCQICPAGTYSATVSGPVASSCSTCPANSVSVAGSSTCKCKPGYKSSGSGATLSCTECPENTYSPGDTATVCTACPDGSTSAVASSTCTCSANYWTNGNTGADLVCKECPARSTSPGGTATTCSCNTNTYSNGETDMTKLSCTTCPDNSVSTGGSVATCTCNDNTYTNNLAGGLLRCDPCPTNSASTSGATTCTCNTNTFTNEKLAGELICTTCPDNSEGSGTTTTCTCSDTYYGNGLTGASLICSSCLSVSCGITKYQDAEQCGGNDNGCRSCLANCDVCTDATTCNTCSTWYSGPTCQCNGNTGQRSAWKASISSCSACSDVYGTGCETCNKVGASCFQCSEGFVPDGTGCANPTLLTPTYTCPELQEMMVSLHCA